MCLLLFLMMYNSVIDKNERQKMKLKEIEVGMAVIDKHGNEYIVESVDKDGKLMKDSILMPVLLKCTKFSSNILVQQSGGIDVEFSHKGQTFYIYKSKKVARNDGCDVDCITVKSLKLKGN